MTEDRDWPREIAIGVVVRQRLAEVDKLPLYDYPFPRVAATPQDIATAEDALGRPLDPRYRDFLGFANGWPKFIQDIDLFGTTDLLPGGQIELANESLLILDSCGAFDPLGITREQLLPIAASTTQTDLFLIHLQEPGVVSPVLWMAGELIESYPSFDEFYLAMLDYQRRQIQKFERG